MGNLLSKLGNMLNNAARDRLSAATTGSTNTFKIIAMIGGILGPAGTAILLLIVVVFVIIVLPFSWLFGYDTGNNLMTSSESSIAAQQDAAYDNVLSTIQTYMITKMADKENSIKKQYSDDSTVTFFTGTSTTPTKYTYKTSAAPSNLVFSPFKVLNVKPLHYDDGEPGSSKIYPPYPSQPVTPSDTTPTVTSVLISPSPTSMQKGMSTQFRAAVDGTNSPNQAVTWSVSGNKDDKTLINSDGLLAVSKNETSSTLTVTATSVLDPTKIMTSSVTVVPNKIIVFKTSSTLPNKNFLYALNGSLNMDENNHSGDSNVNNTFTDVMKDKLVNAFEGAVTVTVTQSEPVLDTSKNTITVTYSLAANCPSDYNTYFSEWYSSPQDISDKVSWAISIYSMEFQGNCTALTSQDLISFLEAQEGFSATVYDVYNPTIGYGHLLEPGESYSTMTQQEAQALLQSDMPRYSTSIDNAFKGITLTQTQHDALSSFAYNLGPNIWSQATKLVSDIKGHATPDQLCKDFVAFDNANSEPNGKGLLYNRRMAEWELFCYGKYTAP
jgi:GH24 family phage-related lysozyme (muramidase)